MLLPIVRQQVVRFLCRDIYQRWLLSAEFVPNLLQIHPLVRVFENALMRHRHHICIPHNYLYLCWQECLDPLLHVQFHGSKPNHQGFACFIGIVPLGLENLQRCSSHRGQ